MSVKIYIFESVKDAFDFEHPQVMGAVPEPINIGGDESAQEEDEEDDEPAPKRQYKKHKKAEAKKSAKRGRPTCGNCGKPGHNAKTCSESTSSSIERVVQGKPGIRHCKNCGKPGHRADGCPDQTEKRRSDVAAPTEEIVAKTGTAAALNPDELAAEIHRLQEDGLTSIQIAAKLRTNLMTVNRYWDPDIATDKGHKEEEDELSL